MSTSNWKVVRQDPTAPATKPYIKGTETPNYYLVTGETAKAIYGFRPLAVAVPPVGSQPLAGVQTRVRVVPKDAADYEKFACVHHVLGFDKKDPSGDGHIHYSIVTSDAPAVLRKVETLLSLL